MMIYQFAYWIDRIFFGYKGSFSLGISEIEEAMK